jgi:hypothetical protein
MGTVFRFDVDASHTFYLVVVAAVFSSLQNYIATSGSINIKMEDSTRLLQRCPSHKA